MQSTVSLRSLANARTNFQVPFSSRVWTPAAPSGARPACAVGVTLILCRWWALAFHGDRCASTRCEQPFIAVRVSLPCANALCLKRCSYSPLRVWASKNGTTSNEEHVVGVEFGSRDGWLRACWVPVKSSPRSVARTPWQQQPKVLTACLAVAWGALCHSHPRAPNVCLQHGEAGWMTTPKRSHDRH